MSRFALPGLLILFIIVLVTIFLNRSTSPVYNPLTALVVQNLSKSNSSFGNKDASRTEMIQEFAKALQPSANINRREKWNLSKIQSDLGLPSTAESEVFSDWLKLQAEATEGKILDEKQRQQLSELQTNMARNSDKIFQEILKLAELSNQKNYDPSVARDLIENLGRALPEEYWASKNAAQNIFNYVKGRTWNEDHRAEIETLLQLLPQGSRIKDVVYRTAYPDDFLDKNQ